MKENSSKFDFIHKEIEQRIQDHRLRTLHSITPSLNDVEVVINGQILTNFCSNDYLGLSVHPEVIERSKQYLERYGAGSTSSRLISGTYDIHEALEAKLAATFGVESALIFNSGFQANVGILSAMADRNSAIFIDKKCHNSLYQGVILSRAEINRYNHNDFDHLKSLLEKIKKRDYNRIFIISETVFSMDGDRSSIHKLIELSNIYNAILYSDDAHALGVLGDKGLGLNFGHSGIDLSIGTFGKSFGGFGAFVGCSQEIRSYLINKASGFIYTTALPPAVIGGLNAALDLIPTMNDERTHLFNLISIMNSELNAIGFQLGESNTQIIPLIIGDEKKTIDLSNFMRKNNMWVSAVRPPTVEKGASRLRITLTARHTENHVHQFIEVLKKWKK